MTNRQPSPALPHGAWAPAAPHARRPRCLRRLGGKGRAFRWLLLLIISLSGNYSVRAAPPQPPFLLGWYGGTGAGASLDALGAEHSAGANVTVVYNGLDTVGDIQQQFLDKAASNGLRVLVQIPQEWIGDRDKQIFKPDLAAIDKFVNTYKNHLAVYGWYLYDEPEFQKFPAGAQLQSLYAELKRVDPGHPVAISFGDYHCWNYGGPAGDSSVEDYVMAADLILFDQYPVFDQAEFQPFLRQIELGQMQEYHRLEDIPFMVDNCTNYLKTHHTADYQGFAPILQAFKWDKPDRYPTYGELRYMLYASLVRNVQGVLLWNNYWNADTPEKQTFTAEIAYPLTAEVQTLAAVAQNGTYDDAQVMVNKPLSGPPQALARNLYNYTLAYKLGSDGHNQYLIAVSESRQTQTNVTFTLPTSITDSSAAVLFDGFSFADGAAAYKARTVPLSKNAQGQLTLTDNFTPFQVHVYRFGPAAQ